ncbi:MAG: hypothetical protein IPN67_17195 [Bacteroidales bacterium]|jgi:hypothetical protein|nr:hypothetical protein [Bacteroidales bacterium]
MNAQYLSDVKINEIIALSDQRYYDGTIKMDVEQALIIMLSITHFFKFAMDYQSEWYTKYEGRMNREVEQFKAEQGILNGKDEMLWIIKNGALKYHICIQALLLQTLFALNGTYYRINDRDYEWEEEFDKIFVGMPFSRDFDLAMIKFLLLPLYNSTHDTRYELNYGGIES